MQQTVKQNLLLFAIETITVFFNACVGLGACIIIWTCTTIWFWDIDMSWFDAIDRVSDKLQPHSLLILSLVMFFSLLVVSVDRAINWIKS